MVDVQADPSLYWLHIIVGFVVRWFIHILCVYVLKEIDTLSRETTLSQMFYLTSKSGLL